MINKNKIVTLLSTIAVALTLTACDSAQKTGEVIVEKSNTPAATAVKDAMKDVEKPSAAAIANKAAESNADSAAIADATMVLSQGNFSGRSDHITTGLVSLEKTAAGYQLRFAEDFSLDGAPDPIVAIGNDETYVAANKIGALQNITGAQVYQLPASFTPGQFSEVYVWCEQFSVPLGIAQLTDS